MRPEPDFEVRSKHGNNAPKTRLEDSLAAAVLDTTDESVAAVPWGRWRWVLVYRRQHAGCEYIRLRTFNRHQVKGCWYPAPRFYMVPIEHAEELGSAIIAAGRGQSPGPMPEWYADFEKQYEERAWRENGKHVAE